MMGVVYEADDPVLGHRVALKTIHLGFELPPSADRVQIEERFLVEARVAARLSHPGIVGVHDTGRDAETGILYIALEYLEGRTLAQVVSEGQPLEWRRALEMVRDLARALQHAHAKGVIHRDVKPANVMLLPTGQLKIMDFGIAKIETLRLKLTREGQSLGTPLYMSPEQALARKVDGRADVFSVGAIAYVLLTGRDAFAAPNLVKILVRVVHEDPLPPSQIVGAVPPEVDSLVARALAKEPRDRYPTAEGLAEDAEDILAGRQPRHRAGWTPPEPSRALASARTPVEDLEAQIRAEFESLDAEATARFLEADPTRELAALVEDVAPPEVGARPEPRRPSGSGAPPRRSERSWRVEVALALAVLVVMGAWLLRRSPPAASAPPATIGGEPARLVIDLQHPLRRGSVRVWVDDALVLDETLRARETKKIVAFTLRKGSLDRTLPVDAGPHAVRVEIAWDEERKSASTSASFEAGATRTLEVRLGRLRKGLSLDWK